MFCLHDDLYIYLFKYLSEQDCIALALSGVCDRFAHLYGGRHRLAIQQCYFLTLDSLENYLNSWVCPEFLTSFDVSHCYWLKENFLLKTIQSMSQLSALNIEDTKLNLCDITNIFIKCKLISELGMSLIEDGWSDFKSKLDKYSLDTLSNGFRNLTHLKIIAFNSAYYIDSWPVILILLGFCQNCVDLHLEISYSEEYFWYGPYGKDDYDEEFVSHARFSYFPQLDWMASLNNLAIVKRGNGMLRCYPDECTKDLITWIFSQYLMNSIERLWIQESDVQHVISESQLHVMSMKSILLGSHLNFDLTHDRFRTLEHIGCVGFSELAFLPNLRYIRGYCVDSEGLDDFCRAHPRIEHLLINDNNGLPFRLKDDWKLEKLKTLVYSCSFPKQDILERYVNACPNMETLHVGYSNRTALDPWTSPSAGTGFLKIIHLSRLTNLSFNSFDLFEGNFFASIFKGCPQLASLHLCGGFNSESFHNLCQYLPLANCLRDLRFQFTGFEGFTSSQLWIAMFDALVKCKRLERLVLFEEESYDPRPWSDEGLEDILYGFVSSMERLVAFCFITAVPLPQCTRDEIKRRFLEKLIPIRPAFWFHFDTAIPPANDSTIPRIHYDEIVCPINYFEAPPKF